MLPGVRPVPDARSTGPVGLISIIRPVLTLKELRAAKDMMIDDSPATDTNQNPNTVIRDEISALGAEVPDLTELRRPILV